MVFMNCVKRSQLWMTTWGKNIETKFEMIYWRPRRISATRIED